MYYEWIRIFWINSLAIGQYTNIHLYIISLIQTLWMFITTVRNENKKCFLLKNVATAFSIITKQQLFSFNTKAKWNKHNFLNASYYYTYSLLAIYTFDSRPNIDFHWIWLSWFYCFVKNNHASLLYPTQLFF